jgi:hypothetical protein
VVDKLGLRFCGTRALTELLAGSASKYPAYVERIRQAHTQILKITEKAMSLSMEGKPEAAVKDLIRHGSSNLSGKLIETAYLVLHRYADKIPEAHSLTETVHDLRKRYSTHITRPALGEQKRQAGGLTLRTSSKK